MEIVRNWFRRTFSDPQVVILTVLLLVFGIAIVMTAGMLAPVIASVIIAFVLHPQVRRLERWGLPHLPAVIAVFLPFLALLLYIVFWLLPLLLQQLTHLAQQIPGMMLAVQAEIMKLPERYPQVISEAEAGEFLAALRSELVGMSQRALTYSYASVIGAVTIAVYCILIPFLVFFFLKDRDAIVGWLVRFLPRERALASQVWQEAERQIGNYIRGKLVEIVIVAVMSSVTYAILGLNYAALLAVVTGLSVLIPYVGVVIAAFPVALVAYAQWGLSNEFVFALIAYGVIQVLDGNVLAPVLLGDAVNMHPVAVIVAVLIFGGIWGFWGVFFAIPLATVVQAIINAWPRQIPDQPETVERQAAE